MSGIIGLFLQIGILLHSLLLTSNRFKFILFFISWKFKIQILILSVEIVKDLFFIKYLYDLDTQIARIRKQIFEKKYYLNVYRGEFFLLIFGISTIYLRYVYICMNGFLNFFSNIFVFTMKVEIQFHASCSKLIKTLT